VERGAGRKLTREECDAQLRAVGEKLAASRREGTTEKT
jgi:hypothetical protein